MLKGALEQWRMERRVSWWLVRVGGAPCTRAAPVPPTAPVCHSLQGQTRAERALISCSVEVFCAAIWRRLRCTAGGWENEHCSHGKCEVCWQRWKCCVLLALPRAAASHSAAGTRAQPRAGFSCTRSSLFTPAGLQLSCWKRAGIWTLLRASKSQSQISQTLKAPCGAGQVLPAPPSQL